MFASFPGACRSPSPRTRGVWNGRPLGRKPSPGPGRIQSGSDVWQNRLESSSAPPLGGLPCVELAKLEAGFEEPWRKPQPGSLTSHSTPSVHHPGTPRVDPEPGGCTGELRARPATGQPRRRPMPQLDRARLCGEEGPVLVTSDNGGHPCYAAFRSNSQSTGNSARSCATAPLRKCGNDACQSNPAVPVRRLQANARLAPFRLKQPPLAHRLSSGDR